MKKLIYLFALILLVYQPSPETSGQKKVISPAAAIANRNEQMKQQIELNDDTIKVMTQELQEVSKPKVKVKYRYRTKIQVVHDTIFIVVPSDFDSSYILEDDCPVDTIYLPREPTKRKGFFKKLFNN